MKTPERNLLPMINQLLERNDLPVEDMMDQDLSLFLVEENAGEIQAVGGLQRCGNVALIRSVATAESLRSQGRAKRVVEALEQLAVSDNIMQLYLLTESAQTYFEGLGYRLVDRAEVPQMVQASEQFSTLCPESAAVMTKHLAAN